MARRVRAFIAIASEAGGVRTTQLELLLAYVDRAAKRADKDRLIGLVRLLLDAPVSTRELEREDPVSYRHARALLDSSAAVALMAR